MTVADLRYDDVRQKSIHNSFQRHEGIPDQLLYWRIRSMEVDLHRSDFFGDPIEGDWAVYHDWHDPMSTVARFSQVLEHLRGFHHLVPDHEVVTLFVDIKDPFTRRADQPHSWRVLDELLERHLGSWLFRPGDLLARTPGSTRLREALETAGWPTLRDLRGRFLVVLTGSREQLEHYATSTRTASQRSAFLSTPVDSASDVPGDDDAVFFNINGETCMELLPAVRRPFITRVYYVNDSTMWRESAAGGCHHIATDKVNERHDGWARTRSSTGFPFERLDGRRVTATEAGNTCGVWARSGDLWGEADSFLFHYDTHGPSTIDGTHDFAISSPNSHTEDFVKGAVLARTSLAADAPYFAVVRTGQKHGLRVQFRSRSGVSTTAVSPRIGPSGLWGDDFDQDTLLHVRLVIAEGGRFAEAFGSVDRDVWHVLGRLRFDQPLRHQGIGVSSHGQRRGAKFLFLLEGADGAAPFGATAYIGRRHDGAGWIDWTGSGRWRTRDLSGWQPEQTDDRVDL